MNALKATLFFFGLALRGLAIGAYYGLPILTPIVCFSILH